MQLPHAYFSTPRHLLPRRHARKFAKNLSSAFSSSPKITLLARPYTRREIDTGLSSAKAGKATGVDGIYPEFPKNFGPNACDWLASLFTVIHSTRVIPNIWREANVITILWDLGNLMMILQATSQSPSSILPASCLNGYSWSGLVP